MTCQHKTSDHQTDKEYAAELNETKCKCYKDDKYLTSESAKNLNPSTIWQNHCGRGKGLIRTLTAEENS